MNKIYKIVWSKVKNCYVVASELAKSRTKAPSLVKNVRVLNLSLAVTAMLGIGLFAVDMGFNEVEAADRIWLGKNYITVSSETFFQGNRYTYVAINTGEHNYEATGSNVSYLATDNVTGKTYLAIASNMNTDAGYPWSENVVTLYDGTLYTNGGIGGSGSNGDAITGLSVNGRTITYTKGDGSTGTITTQDTDTTYSAGNGVSLSGTTFSAKAGTNVTVNSNGISVTGNGTVASGNTGLIDGGKLYSEVRPSDNGNYVIYLSPFPEFFL